MKSIIRVNVLLLFLSIGLLVSAQNYYSYNYYHDQYQPKVTVGVKAGLNLSDFTNYVNYNGNQAGFNAGIVIDYAIDRNLYLSSGLEFFNKKMKFDYEDNKETLGFMDFTIPDGVAKAMYVQIPIHVGYKFHASKDVFISIHGGPYVAYGIGGRIEKGDNVYIEGSETPISLNDFVSKSVPGFKRVHYTFGKKGDFNRFDWGLGLGFLFEYQRVGLGFNYDFGLLDVSKIENNVKVRTGYLTLGYKF